ncbi:MAG: hypothetical protein IPH42_17045 [Bacteroidetes bacterium]|nr:hypothetical protein [Bacteroidota bacterium]
MKYLVLIMASSTMFFACNKATSCKLGFMGDDCDIQETPQSITLNSSEVIAFPGTKADGSAWDLTDEPDVFFRIYDGGAQVYQSEIKTNALAGESLVFTEGTPFNFENVTNNYTITFFDDDALLGAEEMGSFSISLYTSDNNFPEVITYTNPGGSSFVFNFHVAYNH